MCLSVSLSQDWHLSKVRDNISFLMSHELDCNESGFAFVNYTCLGTLNNKTHKLVESRKIIAFFPLGNTDIATQ